jgi:signal transduction histidine kinase
MTENSNEKSNSYADVKANVLESAEQRPRNFASLRWKFSLPMLALVVVAAMVATFVVTDGIARGLRDSQINQVLLAARAVNERATALGVSQRREAERVAFTQNVPELVAAHNGPTLQSLVQPLAAAADLDYLFVGGPDAHELVGIQRGSPDKPYVASEGALLNQLGFITAVLSGENASTSGIVRIGTGYALFTAAPIRRNNQIVGVVAVGIALDRAVQSLQGSSLSPIALFGPNRELLYSTLKDASDSLTLSQPVQQQALAGDNLVPIDSFTVAQTPYQVAYVSFATDNVPLGIVGVLQPNNMWYATDTSRAMLALFLSLIAALVVVVAYLGVSLALHRLSRVTYAVQRLAWGDPYARTNLQATDEIGELGIAVDNYAQRVQKREMFLETSLRNQRRETARLTAVISSIPEGVIVQDLDGRVVLMNDPALRLLGSQRAFRASPLNELTAIVTDTLGAALAPGVYSLGDPQRISLDGKMLHAQAAAVLSMTEKRIGTVIMLRDITEDVRRDQTRDQLISALSQETNKSTQQMLKQQSEDAMDGFMKEINRNSIMLQRLISEIRDLSTTDSQSVQTGQQALPAETLLWNVAREWQATAKASDIELHVVILRRNLLVLGEERRLRWAIGNLMDNAVKYTLPRGHITLLLRATDDDQHAQFSIKDTGVGISPNDLPHIFTRFYRGKPVTPNGDPIQTPGTGQGLFIAKRVIEAHGGTIDLTSAVGHGTEIVFTLPLTASVTLNLTEEPARQEVDVTPEEPPQTEETQPHLR